jgi:PEP-CTERM motif-containing protein
MLRHIALAACLLTCSLSAQAAIIILNFSELNGDGNFPATFDGGTENFVIPVGESIVGAVFEGQFGNSQSSSTAVMDVFVNNVLMASCPDQSAFCWITGPVPFSHVYSLGELASLAGGAAHLTVDQLDCCFARLAPSTLTITTAPLGAVPEPSTFALITCGLVGLYWRSCRRLRG